MNVVFALSAILVGPAAAAKAVAEPAGAHPDLWRFVGAALLLVLAAVLRNFILHRKPKEDVFKRIFRDMLNGAEVTAASAVRYDQFAHALQRFEREGAVTSYALLTLSLLAGERDKAEKPIARGTTHALVALFSAMDADGNGQLTWAEWTNYVVKNRKTLAAAQYRSAAEKRKPGVMGVEAKAFVDELEKVPFLLALFNMGGLSKGRIAKLIDVNKDGVITFDEFTNCVNNLDKLKTS